MGSTITGTGDSRQEGPVANVHLRLRRYEEGIKTSPEKENHGKILELEIKSS